MARKQLTNEEVQRLDLPSIKQQQPEISQESEPWGKSHLKGIGKSFVSLATQASGLGERIIRKPLEIFGGVKKLERGQTTAEQLVPEKYRIATEQEKAGYWAGEVAQFLAPMPGGKIKQVGRFWKYQKSLWQGIEFAGKTALQTGGDLEETGVSGAIGVLAPPVERGIIAGIKKVAPVIGDVVASVLARFIGKETAHIKIAFQNPVEVAEHMAQGIIPLEVRAQAVNALKSYKNAVSKTFGEGLEKLQKLTPSFKLARTLLGKFSGARNKMQEVVNNISEGIPAVFRKFGVAVEQKGTKLNFDKLNSAIVASAERKQLQMVFNTIRQQTDFSVKGVERVAERINALAKFEKAGQTRTSALVGEMHNLYSKAIEKVYPALANLRKTYSIEKEIIAGIDDILKSSKNEIANPTAVTSVAKKLSNVFKEDQEAFIKALTVLERKTGINLLKQLAASEFTKNIPATFGSRMAETGFLLGGAIFNPWLIAILPLFSPKVVGKGTVKAGKAFQLGEKLLPTLEKASQGFQRMLPSIFK